MTAALLFTSFDSLFRFAIEHHRLIEVVYGGRRRTVEPHDYGMQGGRERLLVYQISAVMSEPRRSSRGWRLLDVDKITSCDLTDKTFAGSRRASHDEHYDWDVVYARVT